MPAKLSFAASYLHFVTHTRDLHPRISENLLPPPVTYSDQCGSCSLVSSVDLCLHGPWNNRVAIGELVFLYNSAGLEGKSKFHTVARSAD